MNVLTNIGRTLGATFASGGSAAQRLSARRELQSEIDSLSAQRADAVTSLGENLYARLRDRPGLFRDQDGLVAVIQGIDNRLEKAYARLRELDAPQAAAPTPAADPRARICPFCGTRVSADDRFCRGCGKPTWEMDAAIAPTRQKPTRLLNAVCPNCGAPTDDECQYCMRCGAALTHAAIGRTVPPQGQVSDPDVSAATTGDEALRTPVSFAEATDPSADRTPESFAEDMDTDADRTPESFAADVGDTCTDGARDDEPAQAPDAQAETVAPDQEAAGTEACCPRCGTPYTGTPSFCYTCGASLRPLF